MEDKSRFPKKQIKELYRVIYRRIIRKNATHMVGCSQAAADYLFGPGIGQAINNSVDLDRFNIELYPQEPHSTLRLIHVGKFTLQKNQLFLVDVMGQLVKRRKDVRLTMIGAGDDYLSMIKTKIEQLGLNDHIEIKPHDSDVAAEMAAADYFVFPSNFEGFGNVLLEAQAIGLKCFVSTEVTKEVDCGLCTYIELKKGAEFWAKTITEFEKNNGTEKKPADMSGFSGDLFAQKFLEIYQGRA
jgi:glycosyltransferase EpsF